MKGLLLINHEVGMISYMICPRCKGLKAAVRMLTSRKRCIRRAPDVCLPLPKVVLVCAQADVFVRRGGLQLVHLFPQSLRASQRHSLTCPMIFARDRVDDFPTAKPSSTRTVDTGTPAGRKKHMDTMAVRYTGVCYGLADW